MFISECIALLPLSCLLCPAFLFSFVCLLWVYSVFSGVPAELLMEQ